MKSQPIDHPTINLQAQCLPRATVLELWDQLFTSRPPSRATENLACLSVALLELRQKQLMCSTGQQLMRRGGIQRCYNSWGLHLIAFSWLMITISLGFIVVITIVNYTGLYTDLQLGESLRVKRDVYG